ncbi:hypothetical protein RHMOL_Rhmol02G0272600 [Rhododendron molle]|uniref:Uncharacterized protein n=1 Tax=Rhododendron molle TaxID=49168 RepID=A0ACC0PW19_RHOML|nr:hypothetical protein RHMOL_Rhmol02G0272600 [Rhododendron molle]
MDSLHSNIRDWKASEGGLFYCRRKLDIELEGDRGDCDEAAGVNEGCTPSALAGARVDSLQHRLRVESDLNSVDDSKATALVKPGQSIGNGNYVVTLGLETPKKDLTLEFNTGNDVTWIQSQPCIRKFHVSSNIDVACFAIKFDESSVSKYDTCYNFSDHDLAEVPAISFVFGGNVEVPIPFPGILISSQELACLAFAGQSDDLEMGIFGNWQQQTLDAVYDVADQSKRESLKVVHRHGPCSRMNEARTSAPTLVGIMSHDKARVESLQYRLHVKSERNSFDDSKVTLLAKPG